MTGRPGRALAIVIAVALMGVVEGTLTMVHSLPDVLVRVRGAGRGRSTVLGGLPPRGAGRCPIRASPHIHTCPVCTRHCESSGALLLKTSRRTATYYRRSRKAQRFSGPRPTADTQPRSTLTS